MQLPESGGYPYRGIHHGIQLRELRPGVEYICERHISRRYKLHKVAESVGSALRQQPGHEECRIAAAFLAQPLEVLPEQLRVAQLVREIHLERVVASPVGGAVYCALSALSEQLGDLRLAA